MGLLCQALRTNFGLLNRLFIHVKAAAFGQLLAIFALPFLFFREAFSDVRVPLCNVSSRECCARHVHVVIWVHFTREHLLQVALKSVTTALPPELWMSCQWLLYFSLVSSRAFTPKAAKITKYTLLSYFTPFPKMGKEMLKHISYVCWEFKGQQHINLRWLGKEFTFQPLAWFPLTKA